MFLEVIAKDVSDVEIISQSVADRIELCGAMEEDGLTPDITLIEQAASISTKPIRVMIRNHNNGFYYTKAELAVMLEQIEQINQIANIEGYVIGALTPEGQLDVETMKQLIDAAKGRKITCHKACEAIINPQTLIELEKLGVNTVLTQGGLKPIEQNYQELASLVKCKTDHNLKIQILIGGGVNKNNLNELKAINPCIHVGKLVRDEQKYDRLINDEQITQIKE